MFEGENKYFDKENLEDDLQAALWEPDGSGRLWNTLSDINWEIIEIEKEWDELLKRQEKILAKQEKESRKKEEEPSKPGSLDDRWKKQEEERNALEERLENTKKRGKAVNRQIESLVELTEKITKQLEDLIPFYQQPVNQKLQAKVDNWTKPMSKEDLLNFHFETLKRDKSLPSRKVVLDSINKELDRKDNQQDIKKRDRQEKESKSGLPGPTKRMESEQDEKDLMTTYLQTRRKAQELEGKELQSLWMKRADMANGDAASLKDFLLYKAYTNEFIARYRIAERGSLDSFVEG
jgi:hypothetical protein